MDGGTFESTVSNENQPINATDLVLQVDGCPLVDEVLNDTG